MTNQLDNANLTISPIIHKGVEIGTEVLFDGINGMKAMAMVNDFDNTGDYWFKADGQAYMLVHGSPDGTVAGGYSMDDLEDDEDRYESLRRYYDVDNVVVISCHNDKLSKSRGGKYIPIHHYLNFETRGVVHIIKSDDSIKLLFFKGQTQGDETLESKYASKADKRKAERARQRARALSKVAQQVEVPSHIHVEAFNSDEWKAKMEGPYGTAWEKAKGIVLSLNAEGVELRQPTFDGWSPDEFITAMRNLNTDPKMEKIEDKFAAKFGSYKALPYKEWANKVHELWMHVEWQPDYPTLNRAVDYVVSELKEALAKTDLSFIQPLTVLEALEKTPKDGNSGWPFFTSKWHLNEEALAWYTNQAYKLIGGVNTLKGCPHILFKRTQPNGSVPKMRPVECPPKHDAIAAKVLTDGFINLFKTMKPYAGFNGGENVWQYIDHMMGYKYLIESDFSGFDQRCQNILPYVFKVIALVCEPRFRPYLSFVLDYYQHAELITPIGILSSSQKINGLMSGEGWTSVIGTITNSIAVVYTMMRMGQEPGSYERLTFGDDIAIAADEFNVDLFEKYMLELGMDCNRSKQNVSSGPEAYFSFLGYYHFRDDHAKGNRGKFPICRLAPGLYYKEFQMSPSTLTKHGLDEETVRNLRETPEAIDMVAIAAKLNNCKDNDDFESLVKLVRENSPRRLDTDYIMPFEAVRLAVKNGRKSRNMGLANSEVVQLLYRLEIEEGRHVSNDTQAIVERINIGGLDLDFFI